MLYCNSMNRKKSFKHQCVLFCVVSTCKWKNNNCKASMRASCCFCSEFLAFFSLPAMENEICMLRTAFKALIFHWKKDRSPRGRPPPISVNYPRSPELCFVIQFYSQLYYLNRVTNAKLFLQFWPYRSQPVLPVTSRESRFEISIRSEFHSCT